MNTKNIFKITGFLSALFCLYYFLQPADVSATVGACANCHVMHASHTDAATTTTNTPSKQLLTAANCIGCHGDIDKDDNGTPTVYTTAAFTGTELAGGNFYWVDEGGHGDRYGHNVDEIVNDADTPFSGNPPGFSNDASFNPIGDTFWAANTLRCAGQWGCHGNHADSVSMKAMGGAHHNNQSDANSLDGTTIGTSFRFLLGVKGKEDPDWERTFDAASDHNVYYGVKNGDDLTVGDDNATISFFCARCHGDFHSDDGTPGGGSGGGGLSGGGTWGTDWVRHPVDYSIPLTAGTEYASYKLYKQSAPVATSDLTDTAATPVTDSNYRVVMCLSCHRSHGSEFEHMLRFDDQAMIVGGAAGNAGEGCFACHSDKE